MENVKAPIVRRDQIQPFTEDQVSALLEAAKQAKYPKQDVAIVLFLLDTGVRASELCGLRMQDVDLIGKKVIVLGKGNKQRNGAMEVIYSSRTSENSARVPLTRSNRTRPNNGGTGRRKFSLAPPLLGAGGRFETDRL